MRQFSKARSAVGLARSPSFVVVSTWVTLNPGASFGTMNSEIPSWPFVPGSLAYTCTKSAMLPFEMNRFWPLRTHSSFSVRAVVWRFPESLLFRQLKVHRAASRDLSSAIPINFRSARRRRSALADREEPRPHRANRRDPVRLPGENLVAHPAPHQLRVP